MKTITKLFVLFLFSFFYSIQSNAQIYSGMTYQAVIRNSGNVLLANTLVGVKISILQDTETGTVVFAERHTPTTNPNGLATFVIGQGTLISGGLFSINWLNGPYFIKTETDPTGGSTYSISGTSQLNTVPYALFSENSLYAAQSGDAWKKTGNVVDVTTDFIGSTNDVDVVFKRNNVKSGAISNNNISFGLEALVNINNLIANNNSAFGSRALKNNISGFNNTAVGTNALFSNNASFNTAVGVASSPAITDGGSNTSMGHFALKTNTSGSFNTAIGKQSLEIATGEQNTAIGWGSLGTLSTGGGNIAIGKLTNVPSPTTNNQLSIGNVIYGTNMGDTALGTIGIGVPVPTEKLEVAGKTKTTNLQVTNGAGVNKVLISDAGGNATWQSPVSSNANTGIDIAKGSTIQIVRRAIYTKINFEIENIDDANAYNVTNNEWIIPSTGFYHTYATVQFQNAIVGNSIVKIGLYVNGSIYKEKNHVASGFEIESYDFTADLKFNKGDIIDIRVYQGSSISVQIDNNSDVYFSGFKVY